MIFKGYKKMVLWMEDEMTGKIQFWHMQNNLHKGINWNNSYSWLGSKLTVLTQKKKKIFVSLLLKDLTCRCFLRSKSH